MRWHTVVFGAAMFALGLVAGQAPGKLATTPVFAQDEGLSEDTAAKVKAANDALVEAMNALASDGKYESLSDSPNAFLILSGGGNAVADLDSGLGVDPETFAALYAGQVKPELLETLGKDDLNRVTYNGTVVRMYSKDRLKKVWAERIRWTSGPAE